MPERPHNQPGRTSSHKPVSRLPEFLRPLFWEYRFGALSWEEDRDLITGRILSSGGWEAEVWLRK